MRSLVAVLALIAAIAATPPVATAQAVIAEEEASYVPPTERYGVAWGNAPESVVEASDRAPDSDQPAGALTYLGRSGGQTIYTFGPGGLAAIVEATPLISDPDVAAEEHARYKAALVALYGTPVLEDSERPGDRVPPIVDAVWTPGSPLRAVELTMDSAEQDGALGHFVYVRMVGPDLSEQGS